jgi:hypothetical protein
MYVFASVRLNAGGFIKHLFWPRVLFITTTLFTNLTMLNYPCFFFIRIVSLNVAAFFCSNYVFLLISGMLADIWVDLIAVVVIRVSVAAA